MEDKKKKKVLIISIISGIVLLAGIGLTVAYLLSRTTSSNKTFTAGNLAITYTNEAVLNLTNKFPIYEDEITSKASSVAFKVTNTGNIKAYIEIQLTNISMSNALKSSDFKWKLYDTDTNTEVASGDFTEASTTLSLTANIELSPSTYKNYKLYAYIEENGGDQSSMMNTSFSGKVVINGTAKRIKYRDTSGANSPQLVEGMIPVVYNESTDNWQVADTYTNWYNYKEQMWANAVTVNDATYRTASTGTDIPMEKIDTMWVWIPRYKYKITSNIGSSSNVTNPPQIDVVFESGTETTGTELSSCSISSTNCYYTHPAFRDGTKEELVTSEQKTNGTHTGWDNELSGIWVGKFETGGTADTPLIKPDIVSLRGQNVSTQFQTSLKFAGGTMDTSSGAVSYGTNQYGLTRNSTTDSHMVKNTEWGAVAYLSQSKYGKYGNSNYTGTNKEIYINNSSSYYTGRSGGTPSQSSTTYGTYGYNDKGSCSTTCTGSKTTLTGTGASTTGTIYGIYDMSGGAWEYTMSNWAGTVGSSGFNSAVLTSTTSTVKRYYDKYTGTSSITATSDKSIKGDATYETERWYSDSALFVDASVPWAYRGGLYSESASAGAFYFNGSNGGTAFNRSSFRSALIP